MIHGRLPIRPEVFSLVFVAWYIFVLFNEKYKKNAYLCSLIFIQALWVNIHGYFFVGISILLVFLIGEFSSYKLKRFLPYDWGKECKFNSKDYKRLLITTAACILVSLLNPNGVRGLFYPIQTLMQALTGQRFFFEFISELQSPLAFDRGIPFKLYKILIWFSVACFLLNFKKINITKVLLFVLFCHFSYTAVRNTTIFAIVAMPICIYNLSNAYQSLKEKRFLRTRLFQGKFQLLVNTLIIIVVIMYFSWMYNGKYYGPYAVRRFALNSRFGVFPKEALDFIDKTGLKGNCFNSFNLGSYLSWRYYPRGKISIDGRTEVYGKDICKFNEHAFAYPEVWEELIQRFGYKIDWVICESTRKHQWALIEHLYNDPDWCLIYHDEISCIFIKKKGINNSLIKTYCIDKKLLKKSKPDIEEVRKSFEAELDLQNKWFNRFFFTRLKPEQRLWRYLTKMSMFFNAIKLYDLAEYYTGEAVALEPLEFVSYNNLGHILKEKKCTSKAITQFNKLLVLSPENVVAHKELAFLYLKQKDQANAFKHWERFRQLQQAKLGPVKIISSDELPALYEEKEKLIEELTKKAKAVKRNPKNTELALELAIEYHSLRKHNEALKVAKEALSVKPKNKKIKSFLNKVYSDIGLPELGEMYVQE